MRGTVTAGVSLSGDLVLVIDRIGDTPTAAEGADGSHGAILISIAEKVTDGIRGELTMTPRLLIPRAVLVAPPSVPRSITSPFVKRQACS